MSWTAEKLRERLAGCRLNRRVLTRTHSYRTINCALYVRHRRELTNLLSAEGSDLGGPPAQSGACDGAALLSARE